MDSGTLNALVVDDEANIRRSLVLCLEGEGWRAWPAGRAEEALEQAEQRPYDVAFVDLRLGLRSGLDLIPRLIRASPGVRVVLITAYASIESAVLAIKRGAFDYLSKPFTPAEVVAMARRAAAERATERRGREPAVGVLDLESRCPEMRRALELARQAASSDATLLIRGETGTGKGVLARAIHGWSARGKAPFAVISCPSIPTELLESELFGHARGAFTGAHREQPGRIAQAQGGTLFLDEIGDLPAPLQAKLLRFVQDHEYERLGEPGTRKADVRVLAATHVDLQAAVSAGRFREDLYYRLNVIEILLPPLRERREDILPLAESLLERFSAAHRRPGRRFDAEARRHLESRAWPGNLRELNNAVERAAILAPGHEVRVEDLAPPVHLPPASPGSPKPDAEDLSLEALEKRHIRHVLGTNRSLEDCARILGIDTATLWRKRKKFGMTPS